MIYIVNEKFENGTTICKLIVTFQIKRKHLKQFISINYIYVFVICIFIIELKVLKKVNDLN